MPHYQPTPAESEALAAQHLPLQFKGRESISPAIVHAFRNRSQNIKSVIDLIEGGNSSEIMPLVADLKQRVQFDNIDSNLAEKFLAEIALVEQAGAVDPLWVLIAYFRYATAISEISPEEKDLFAHLVYPFIFNGLAGKGFMGNAAFIANIIGDSDTVHESGRNAIQFDWNNLHNSTFSIINKELRKFLPSPVLYPFAKFGKVGMSFLIACYIEQIYVLGLPPRFKPTDEVTDSKTAAHGTKMSPLSFILHDALHASVDPRYEALAAYLSHSAGAYVKKGGDGEQFIKWYAPRLAASYDALMTCLRAVNYMFQSYLLPYYGKKEFQKTMVGFFFAMHEYPSYESKSMTDTNIDSFFDGFVRGAKTMSHEHQMWESWLDPLDTSPLDGDSSFTDAELVIYAFKHYLCNDSKLQLSSSENDAVYQNLGDDADKAQSKIASNRIKVMMAAIAEKPKVKRSPKYIDVEFRLRSGQKLKYNFPTLLHKWLNMDDSLALLRLAGIVVPKPKIDHLSRDEARKVAKETLEVVGKHIIATVEHFISRAKNLASRNLLKGKSLTTAYFDWKFKQNTRIDEEITRSLSPKPKLKS